MTRRSWLAALLLTAVGSPMRPVAAIATHLPDHRFLVLGYLSGPNAQPLAGVPVLVTRLKTGLEYRTRTEPDGFYFVVLHLHDEDLGEMVRIRAGTAVGEVRVHFDVANRKVERGTRVDFRDGRMTEDRRAFAETLRVYLAR
jgi:hypothetical protein